MVNAARGRPAKDDANKAVAITIERRHLEMLDEAILQREMYSGGAIYAASDGYALANRPGETYAERQESVEAAKRREFLGELIEKHCSFEARHPVRVKVHAPLLVEGTLAKGKATFKECGAWMAAQEERLNRERPEAIENAITHNSLQRLRRSDPAAYRDALKAALGATRNREEIKREDADNDG